MKREDEMTEGLRWYFAKLLKFRLCMGSSPILIGAGNKLIGGLSALGAGGCEFKSQFLDKDHLYGLMFIEHKSMLRESMLELVILFPVMAT